MRTKDKPANASQVSLPEFEIRWIRPIRGASPLLSPLLSQSKRAEVGAAPKTVRVRGVTSDEKLE